MVDIDQSVKTYYERTRLSEEQLEKLAYMKEGLAAEQRRQKQSIRFGAIAAAGCVLAILAFFLGGQSQLPIANRIAQEVAMNHKKALNIEYQADSFASLSQKMEKLDFTLLVPGSDLMQQMKLVGARYCSIQGGLAAQIKMTDNTGRIYTLYQTRSTETFETMQPNRLQEARVDIRIWKEQGILFALAGDTIE